MTMNFIFSIVYYIGLVLDFVGIIIVAASSFWALYKFLLKKAKTVEIREELAHHVILGLEFIIAADVLIVTTAKNIDDVVFLGAIVLVRVMLGYSLRREFRRSNRGFIRLRKKR